MSIDLTLQANEDGADIAVAGWRIGRFGLPRRLAPETVASERIDRDSRMVFDVSLSLPLVGRLAHYHGWLTPVGDRFLG